MPLPLPPQLKLFSPASYFLNLVVNDYFNNSRVNFQALYYIDNYTKYKNNI
jgi:hypothetical protein